MKTLKILLSCLVAATLLAGTAPPPCALAERPAAVSPVNKKQNKSSGGKKSKSSKKKAPFTYDVVFANFALSDAEGAFETRFDGIGPGDALFLRVERDGTTAEHYYAIGGDCELSEVLPDADDRRAAIEDADHTIYCISAGLFREDEDARALLVCAADDAPAPDGPDGEAVRKALNGVPLRLDILVVGQGLPAPGLDRLAEDTGGTLRNVAAEDLPDALARY